MNQTINTPWAMLREKYKSDGDYADYLAWKEWFKSRDEYDDFDDLDETQGAHLYSTFCECYSNYSWSFENL